MPIDSDCIISLKLCLITKITSLLLIILSFITFYNCVISVKIPIQVDILNKKSLRPSFAIYIPAYFSQEACLQLTCSVQSGLLYRRKGCTGPGRIYSHKTNENKMSLS